MMMAWWWHYEIRILETIMIMTLKTPLWWHQGIFKNFIRGIFKNAIMTPLLCYNNGLSKNYFLYAGFYLSFCEFFTFQSFLNSHSFDLLWRILFSLKKSIEKQYRIVLTAQSVFCKSTSTPLPFCSIELGRFAHQNCQLGPFVTPS